MAFLWKQDKVQSQEISLALGYNSDPAGNQADFIFIGGVEDFFIRRSLTFWPISENIQAPFKTGLPDFYL